MKRAPAAASATVAAAAMLFAGLTACTSDGAEKHPAPHACKGGTYSWSDVRQKSTLTGLAKPVTVQRKASSYTADIDPLKGARRTVTFTTLSEGLEAKTAITSLGKHIGSRQPLAPLGEEIGDKPLTIEDASGDMRPGAYFAWSYADVVEANFAYRCGDADPARGHIVTWSGTGISYLPCFRRNGDADAASLAAALKSCPRGSPAADKP
ncbi:hypothetical protein ACFQ7F_23515 [Streptomyces sp. NPDC056486]|uniref:hypothetical protein n=1 Tax=Streptomyces sp. NPDC056486 TaxID=3345835 RepID=UPI0036776BF2